MKDELVSNDKIDSDKLSILSTILDYSNGTVHYDQLEECLRKAHLSVMKDDGLEPYSVDYTR